MLLPLLSSQKRNRQRHPSWVHPPNTINLAGRAKRHGGRTLTLKISRRNWRVFARRNVHSGACFSLTFFFVLPSSNVICRLALHKKTDSELFIVDTKGDDKGMHYRHFPSPTKSSHIILVFLSSKIPATFLPYYPEVTPNHLSALCRACRPCTAPKIPREFARKRAAAQNCAKGSQGTAEQHRGPITAWRG
jgi:hypothetical protein